MPSFVGAIDNGTTSSRFLIFNEHGELVIGHQLEYRQIFPHPGWVEQDPMDILSSVISCVDGALRKFELQGNDVKNLKGKASLKEICGLPITTYFSAVKLCWLLEHSSDVKEAHDNGNLMFGTVDSWLIYNLTGGVEGGAHVTDVTNASRTMLMDIRTLKWSEKCLEFFGFNANILPEIKPSSSLFGEIKYPHLADLTGLPIAGCLGDQQAALVGQRCFQVGEAKNTYGTGCFMVFNTGKEIIPSNNGLLSTVGYQFEGEPAVYALEGSIAVAGSAVKWLRDNMGIIKSAEEINVLAAGTKDSGGVIFVTAFSGLFAPYWRPDVRGSILGISQHTTKHHLARATLEATCFQTRAILDAMNTDSGKPLKSLRVDGGLSNSDICMQLQANILGIEVSRPEMRESTALGAATAAAVHLDIGMWKGGFKAFSERIRESKEVLQKFTPKISEEGNQIVNCGDESDHG
ncbi:Glycerol kinase [Modicella reniformis]|uniref:glycerol kinase n=1 Tax=Modicella reniformis TaxID=1440133 RepID=A0A9P6STV9_9FUNG|nr:Glycerol kinase [Modicella reniformis]